MDKFNKIQDCKWDYEKVTANCPHCYKQNIFSRQDDLHTSTIVFSMNVTCEYCNKNFKIGGDPLIPSFMKLYFECKELASKKEYRQAILNLCVAYENLFSFILHLYLTVYPLVEVTETPLRYYRYKKNKELTEILEDKIKSLAFQDMLYLTLKLFTSVDTSSNITIQDSETFISQINKKSPKDLLQKLKDLNNHKIRNTLIVLLCLNNKNKSINILRNKVAHSTAYCPSKKEVETELLIARKIFEGLHVNLQIHTLDSNCFDFIIKNKPSI